MVQIRENWQEQQTARYADAGTQTSRDDSSSPSGERPLDAREGTDADEVIENIRCQYYRRRHCQCYAFEEIVQFVAMNQSVDEGQTTSLAAERTSSETNKITLLIKPASGEIAD